MNKSIISSNAAFSKANQELGRMSNLVKIILFSTLSVFISTHSIAQDDSSDDDSNIENIIITATKKSSTIQEAPLAVNAFSTASLEEKGITDVLDIQFNVPNMLFSKTNFTSSNVSIRGVGNNAIGSSADGGTGLHFSGAYIGPPNSIFESEFYDIDRVEILRGPQGTLYGRNTTAGVINIIPKRPHNNGVEGSVSFESSDYSGRKGTYSLNLPLIENYVQLRIAGFRYQRDGIIFNEATGNFIDDRDSSAYRTSLRIGGDADGWFELILTKDKFDEEDSRLRAGKQVCHKDKSAYPSNLGCLPGQSLYSDDAFGSPASFATLAGFLLGIYPHQIFQNGVTLYPFFTDVNFNCEVYGTEDCRYDPTVGIDKSLYDSKKDGNSDDLRQVNEYIDPYYSTDVELNVANLNIQLGSALTLSLLRSKQKGDFYSNADYAHTAGTYEFDAGAVALTNAVLLGGAVAPYLATNDPGRTGHGQSVNNFNTLVTYDTSESAGESNTTEFRLTSNFDGGFNFMIGSFTFDRISAAAYEVHSNGLAFLSAANPQLGYYRNDTQEYKLSSEAIFSEFYFEGSTIRLTLGFRTTDETKETYARQTLLNSATAQYLPGISGLSSLNTASPFWRFWFKWQQCST